MDEVPNALRMILGEEDPTGPGVRGSEVAVLECSVDDATPQEIAFACRRLFDGGALDVFTTPVQMKKGRLGHHLTVLARPDRLIALARLLFLETSTLGLRFRVESRLELERQVRHVATPYGVVEVKLGYLDGRVVQVRPEYEVCAELARQHGVGLGEVQRAAIEAFRSGPNGAEGGAK